MSKRVAFIHGSPRKKGNTLALAWETMAELNGLGIETDIIDAPRLETKYPGCIACYKCQTSSEYGCHVDDGLAKAVTSLLQFDAVVMAAPVYWFSFPAQAKMFVDRMFSLIKFDADHRIISPLLGKPLGLLATAGGVVEDNMEMLEKLWEIPARRLGSPFVSCLFPQCHYEPGKAASNPELAAKARAFGRELAGLLA